MHHQILGFDLNGQITNINRLTNLSWEQIAQESSKIITFIDVAGAEKYAHTMITGVVSNYPDYIMMLIDVEVDIPKTAVDQFNIVKNFSVPIIIVITKIDRATPDQVADKRIEIQQMLQGSNRILFPVHDNDEMALSCRNFATCVPLFELSNVTLQGLDLFLKFLQFLPKHIQHNEDD